MMLGLSLAACSATSTPDSAGPDDPAGPDDRSGPSDSSGPSAASSPCTPTTPTPPTTPPTRAQYDDTAQALALITALPTGGGGVTSMSDVISLARGSTPEGLSVRDGHVQGTRRGVDYGYALSCKTAAGVTDACGAATAQATADAKWSAEVDLPGIAASVSAMASWSAGLGLVTAELTGESAFSASLTLQSIFHPSVMASYSFNTCASYDVKVAPLSPQIVYGSATADVTARALASAGATVTGSFEVHAKITFHGGDPAEIMLDNTEHYTLDLTTGEAVRDTTP